MSRSPQVVQAEMLALSPPGYTRSLESVWAAQLLAAATEASLFEGAAEEMAAEIDPRTAVNLLPDWQALFGADPYGIDISALDTAQLQAYFYQRLVNRGGQSVSFFEGIGAALGVTVALAEVQQTVFGDAVFGGSIYCETPAQFQWSVALSGGTPTAQALVAATIQDLAALHTLPVFLSGAS